VDKNILVTGRRKEAVARVKIFPGEGKIIINGKDIKQYFKREESIFKVMQPLVLTSTTNVFNIIVKTKGGGETGQSEAILLGIARALVKNNEKLKPILRQNGFLTRDARKVERKKFGHPKARKRFQFSKR